MIVAMTSPTRVYNSDRFARNGIHGSIRGACKAAFGVSQEERFRRPRRRSWGRPSRNFGIGTPKPRQAIIA
jgi:hypothetical protein